MRFGRGWFDLREEVRQKAFDEAGEVGHNPPVGKLFTHRVHNCEDVLRHDIADDFVNNLESDKQNAILDANNNISFKLAKRHVGGDYQKTVIRKRHWQTDPKQNIIVAYNPALYLSKQEIIKLLWGDLR